MIKTALIVEDCPLTIEMTRFFLHKLGIDKILAISNHQSFVKLVNSNFVPDLVVTDWNIDNKLNGSDVISKMSQYNIPVAVLSSEEKMTQYMKSPKYNWFKKPLNFSDFKNWIEDIDS